MASSPSSVLVTGGTGFIGSHTCIELLNAGFTVTILDNLVNSSEKVISRVKKISDNPQNLHFEERDLMDTDSIRECFQNAIDAGRAFQQVIHFAGLKAVGESVKQPLRYYSNNITGTLHLLKVMEEFNCYQIVFSSSATVYGSAPPPYDESSQVGVGITNAYGWTKFMLEQIMRDCHKGAPDKWGVALLRYFNPVGAHESGRIGEDPQGFPNNLMPFVQQVATGRREKLTVFGNDYDTHDGTAERDYIHVVDLAKGHLAALDWLARHADGACEAFNLGTGKRTSVLDIVHAFSKAANKEIPYEIGPRREGDLPVVYCIPNKAETELRWKATKTLEDMCRDTWRWCNNNPYGYRTEEK